MKITYSTFSEKGPRRENQDFIQTIIDENKGRYTFVLCDGMGGHAAGEVAAELAVTAFCEVFEGKCPSDPEEGAALLSEAARLADARILAYAAGLFIKEKCRLRFSACR